MQRNSLLVTQLQELGQNRARSQGRIQNKEEKNTKSIFENNQLPVILDKFKENFLDHMINIETKYANLPEIEEYYTNKIDKINQKYNCKAEKIERKKDYIKELDQRISNVVALGNKVDTDFLHDIYGKKIVNLKKKM